MTGASSATARAGVAALAIAVHQVDAVVDADADERHHREQREEIELDAGQRQQAGRPHQADHRRHQREQRQPPVAERAAITSATTMTVPIARPFEELRQEALGQLAVDERQAGQRLRRIDARRRPSRARATSPALDGKDVGGEQPPVAVARDEAAERDRRARAPRSRRTSAARAGSSSRGSRAANGSNDAGRKPAASAARRRATRRRSAGDEPASPNRCARVEPAWPCDGSSAVAAATAAAGSVAARPPRRGARSIRAAARGPGPRQHDVDVAGQAEHRRRCCFEQRRAGVTDRSRSSVGLIRSRVAATPEHARSRRAATARIAPRCRGDPRREPRHRQRARAAARPPARQQRRHQHQRQDAADHHAVADQHARAAAGSESRRTSSRRTSPPSSTCRAACSTDGPPMAVDRPRPARRPSVERERVRDVQQHDAVHAEAEQHRGRAGRRRRQRGAGEARARRARPAATAPTAASRRRPARGCGRRGTAAAGSAPAIRPCSRMLSRRTTASVSTAMRWPPANSTCSGGSGSSRCSAPARRRRRLRRGFASAARSSARENVGVERRPRRAGRSPGGWRPSLVT